MYQKHLRDQKPVYFRYAPPLAVRSDDDDKLPNPPFADAKPWQCSVYYYWWLFMRECHKDMNYRFHNFDKFDEEEATPSSPVDKAFGDVSEIGFLKWWIMTGRHLFAEPIGQGVRALGWGELDNGINREGGRGFSLSDRNIYLAIPVHQDFEKSIDEVKAFLKQAKARAPAMTYDAPLFPVFTKPVLTSLEKIYQAWTLRNSHPDTSLADIAVRAGLAANSDNSDTATKAANASAASRALSQASYVIKWVERGVFPVTSKSQEENAGIMAEKIEEKLRNADFMRDFRRVICSDRNKKFLLELAEKHGFDLGAAR